MHAANEPPRQLSTDRKSLNYDPCYRRVEVALNGIKRPGDVHEYDMDEGWMLARLKRADGRYKLDEHGDYVTKRLEGIVTAWFTEKTVTPVFDFQPATAPHDDDAARQKAADKKARKAAKFAALAERNATR